MSAEQKYVAKLTRTRFKTMLNKYAGLTLTQLDKELQKKNLTVMEVMVLKFIKEAVKQKKTSDMDWILDHLNGKLSQTQNLNVKTESDDKGLNLSNLSTEELIQMKELMEKAKK